MKEIIGLILRHTLTAAGFSGVMDDEQVSQIVGALSLIIGIVWSIWQKKQAATKLEDAKQ
jgi:hypothetical protein